MTNISSGNIGIKDFFYTEFAIIVLYTVVQGL